MSIQAIEKLLADNKWHKHNPIVPTETIAYYKKLPNNKECWVFINQTVKFWSIVTQKLVYKHRLTSLKSIERSIKRIK